MRTTKHRYSLLTLRLAAAPLAAVLALSAVTHAQQPAPAPQAEASYRSAIEKKLRTIVLPSVDIDNLPIEEAVDYLRTEGKAQDKAETDESKKGVSFWIQGQKGVAFPRATLKLKNVTLGDALNGLAKLTNTEPSITGSSVALVPKDGVGKSEAPVPGALAAAKQTSIELIEIESKPLDEVVEFLNQKSAEKKGPKVIIGDGVDPKSTVKEIRLRDSTLAEAIFFVASQAGCKYVATEDTLRLLPR